MRNASKNHSWEPRNGREDDGRGNPADPEEGEDFNLNQWLGDLWEGRNLILSSIAVALVIGLLYAFSASPVYQAEGLLQTETQKTYSAQNSEFTKLEGLYALPTVALGEMEILKSNMILGRAVEALSLDIVARPILRPVIGRLLARNRATRPALDVDSFVIPDRLRGVGFKLVAMADGGFRVLGPDASTLTYGRPGDRLTANYQGNPISLKVKSLRGKPGQEFALARSSELDTINELRQNLTVEEKGKNSYVSSNILWLSYQSSDPDRAAQILNEILNQYIRQTIERKAGESSKALTLLKNQQPLLQSQLAEAESRLNEYRKQAGAIDAAREGELYLQQGSTLESQISALKQKRQELLRTYTENSDLVTTVDQQMAHLRAESQRVNAKVLALPHTQQEIIRLSREAQVKAEMYTSLVNSIQQLQNTLAGSVGNARVVDYAIPAYDAIAPKKKVLVLLFLFLGTVVGTGLTILRRLLSHGIEDHRIIETKLGLPILVTVPHSKAQRGHDLAILKRDRGLHVLANSEPEDIATESFRSLRTILHLTMEKAADRVVLVTGPSPAVGKSFVSTNLATVLAQGGGKVLLVDADLRKGNLHNTFGIKGRVGGLSEVLKGLAAWPSVVQETQIPGLSLITTGLLPPDPLVLIMSTRFNDFLAEVGKAFDFVILDAPPVLPVTDALAMGTRVDSILVVARYGVNPLDEMRLCQKRLENLSDRVRGCIFTDIKLISVAGIYGYYKYSYEYKYRSTV